MLLRNISVSSLSNDRYLLYSAASSTFSDPNELLFLGDRIGEVNNFINKYWKSLWVGLGVTSSIFLGAWFYFKRKENILKKEMENVSFVLSKKIEDELNIYFNLVNSLKFKNQESYQVFSDIFFNSLMHGNPSTLIINIRDTIEKLIINKSLNSKVEKDFEKLHSYISNISKLKRINERLVLKNMEFLMKNKKEIISLSKKFETTEKKKRYVKIVFFTVLVSFFFLLFLKLITKKKDLSKFNYIPDDADKLLSGKFLDDIENQEDIFKSENVNIHVNSPLLQKFTKFLYKFISFFENVFFSLSFWALLLLSIGISFLLILFLGYKKEKRKDESFLKYTFRMWKVIIVSKEMVYFSLGFLGVSALFYFLKHRSI